MGAWGRGPLDNDNAADWFGDLFAETELRERVAEGLASGHPDAVRAAAWVVAQLGQVYVWPIEHLDADRVAAGAGLLRLRQDDDWIDMWDDREEILAELDEQLDELDLEADQYEQAVEAAGVAGAPEPRKKKTTRRKTPAKKKATKRKAQKAATKKVAATKKTATKKTATKKTATKKTTTKKTTTKKTTTKKRSGAGGKATKGRQAGGWTRLELSDGKSHKFWAIRVDGASHTVHFGRIGTAGQEKTKELSSPEAARADAEKLIAEKRRKGYR